MTGNTTRVAMPDGQPFRTNSIRRYVVAILTRTGEPGTWRVNLRTDKETNALARWRAATRVGNTAAIVDTHTKEVIR